jgi:hypothetical protein
LSKEAIMSWFPRAWFRKSPRRATPPRRPPAVRLTVTELEPRLVPALAPAFVSHGGAVLDSPLVEVVYYGQQWQDPSLAPTRDQIDQFMAYVVDSPFMDVLSQYGVGHGQVTDSVVLPDAVGDNVASSDIPGMLDQHIGDGSLQPPDPNRLYFLFTPPGVTIDGDPTFAGYHTSLVDSQGNQDAFAVVPYPPDGGPATFQGVTLTATHELAEAATDPYGDGWYDDGGQGEVGDICNGIPTYLNNYTVQQVYSAQDGTCVAPAGATPAPADGIVQVTAQDVGGAVAGQPFTATVALVNDSEPNITSDYLTATVGWGDGQVDQGVPLQGPDGNGTFTVDGTHTYGSAGPYTITVTAGDTLSGSEASATATAAVAAPPGLTAAGQDVTATAGQEFTQTVAVVSDPGADPAGLTATVDWGDGQVDQGVPVQGPGADGNFTVDGTHTYAAAGSYAVGVTVDDAGSGTEAVTTATATVQAAQDVTIVPGSCTIDATAGQTYSGPVCEVDLGTGSVPADSLQATVDWGDGTQDRNLGLTPTAVAGQYVVEGTHTFAQAATQPLHVIIGDGHGVHVSATGEALVQSPAPPPPPDFSPFFPPGQPPAGKHHHPKPRHPRHHGPKHHRPGHRRS